MSTTTTMPRAFSTSSVEGPAIAGHQSWVNSAPPSFDTIESRALLAMIATDTATTAPHANTGREERRRLRLEEVERHDDHDERHRVERPRDEGETGRADVDAERGERGKNTTAEPRKNRTTKSQNAARSGCHSDSAWPHAGSCSSETPYRLVLVLMRT